MPFIAIDSLTDRRISYELKPKEYRQDWWCPHCFEMLSFVNTITKTKHFRHPPHPDCRYEPETKEHLDLKKYIFEDLKYSNKVEYEHKAGNRIADVMAFLPTMLIAFEAQVSSIPLSEFLNRTKNYLENKIYPIWILHPKNHLRFYRGYKWEFYYRVSKLGVLSRGVPWILWYWDNSLVKFEFKPKIGINPFDDEEYECSTIFSIRVTEKYTPREVIEKTDISNWKYWKNIRELEES